jgi:hypothetical protein
MAVGAAAALVILAQALPTARVEPIRIAYHAPARCPDEAQFLGEVFARTPLARSAAEGEAAREFAVDIADGSDGALSGSLEIHSTDSPVSRRDITATRCDELVSALALMVALAVDPEGASGSALGPAAQNPGPPGQGVGGAVATWSTPVSSQSAAAVAAPASSPPVPAGTAPTGTAPTGTVPTGTAPAGTPPGPAREPALAAPRSEAPTNAAEAPEPRHGHWAVGTEFLVLAGVVSSPAVGGGATLVYDFVPNRASSPELRFALAAAAATPKLANEIGANLSWAWAHAEGCPLRVVLARSLRLAPCLGFDGGFLSSSGITGLRTAKEQIKPWFAGEAGARLAWTFAGRWLAHAAVAALAPFPRYDFVYNADGGSQTAYRSPPVGLEAELGLAGWLP